MTTETSGTEAPRALPELNEGALTRLAAAWGVDAAECTAMWATAQDAMAAQAEEDAETHAFQAWWKSKYDRPYSVDALKAWLRRSELAAQDSAGVVIHGNLVVDGSIVNSHIATDAERPAGGLKAQHPLVTRIEFSGPVGCGKTTLVKEIGRALETLGRPVAYTERDAQRSGSSHVALLVEKD